MSISIFLPTRKGSQRVKNKNTRPFANYQGGLLELKLRQLMQLNVEEVVLSTNDDECIKIAKSIIKDPKFRIEVRPDNLCSSHTKLVDLIDYVPTVTQGTHILWTHVTSPMVTPEIYEEALLIYKDCLKSGFDSLMSVVPFKNFLWSKEKNDIINRVDGNKWPATQDLMRLYEVNSAMFIASREIYNTQRDRIGVNPFLMEISKLNSVDVDWEEDFRIAEAIYENVYK